VIIPLASPAARDHASAGGKARTLARLLAAGFPVPDGFVVTAPEDAHAGELAERLTALEARGGSGARFAVRSSGQAEDSAAASFAGQFETVLGVRGLGDISRAIERCFASFTSGRANAYQRAVGVRETGGAVIVQQLVEAEAAGVAFTLDPVTGACDRVLVDAASGLGDAVVGGRVTPDGFVVSKTSGEILERRVANARPCLNEDAVRAVAALAQQVDAHEGAPVDIEWAWQDGRAYLLQARPITGVLRAADGGAPPADWTPELNTRIDPRFPLYSNGNVGEILPGCVTPLTYSFFSRGVERAFRDVCESVGSMPDVGPDPVVVGFFFHRVYLNVSYFMTAADNSLGATRDTAYEELIGPAPERHPAWKAGDLLPWRLWRGFRIIGRYLAMQGRLDADIAASHAFFEENRQRFATHPPSGWRADELIEWLQYDHAGLRPAIIHIRASQFANSSFATLRGLTRRLLGDDTGSVASRLVTGIGSIASASPAAGLYDLARLVTADPLLRGWFRDEPDDERLFARIMADTDPASARLRGALQDFVERFGHRGLRETDFRSPCWRERPALVLAQVRQHLEPGSVPPNDIAERQAALSAEAQAKALPAVPAWRRGWVTAIIAASRKHIAAREEMKDLLLRFIDLTRRVIAESQARLSGMLRAPDDIHFLVPSEVAAALRGELDASSIADVVRRRRREFDWSSRIDVPRVQEGVARFVAAGQETVPAGAELRGVPVSPGVVEGRACVVLDPGVAALMPGDVLVAPVTDVAWTPLFLRAAALVVEVGGPLSHGSIVAREFGIPAVTAVAGATARIRSGDRVRVDGDRGIVSILGPR